MHGKEKVDKGAPLCEENCCSEKTHTKNILSVGLPYIKHVHISYFN